MNKYSLGLFLLCLFFSESMFAQYHIQSITDATNGQCNGAIEIGVDTAFAPHTFTWSIDGETGATVTGLCPGIYSVIIEDKYGCDWELEAEVGKESGCYLNGVSFYANITPACPDSMDGNIQVMANNTYPYDLVWDNGTIGNILSNVSAGDYTLTITDPGEVNCDTTFTFNVGIKSECGPAPPVASIPMFINEAYNGTSSSEEFVELVVKGNGTCAPVDIRGYIVDDNNGDFSNPNHGICGTGFSPGHIRFKYIARWAAVAPGSKIIIYNPATKNANIISGDDPIDEDGNGVYILPVGNDGLEGTHKYPSYSFPFYSAGGSEPDYSTAKWSFIALKDDKDAIQIRDPEGAYLHGISYGDPVFINGGPANLQISTTGTLGMDMHFNQDNPNEISHFGLSAGNTATPGSANNSDNEMFLSAIACVGGTMIVNELSNGTGDTTAYVELLVISDVSCGVVDIRGYLLDDNNGDFSITIDQSGIAPGHLRFPNTDTWSNVPGGALIVVYNEKLKNSAIGEDDPTDSDNDGVYILPASHLEGSASSPTQTKPYHYDLTANYSSGTWDYIWLFEFADAMQVLAPDGGYQHGISYGGLGTTNGGPDELLIEASNNMGGKVYSFEDSNPKMVDNFSIGTTASPGMANSTANQTFIDAMSCDSESLIAPTSQRINNKDLTARLFPNPFSNLINIEVRSQEDRVVTVHLHDFLGRLVYEKEETLIKGFNDFSINLDQYVSDGIYFMSIRADKEVLHEEKVICVRKY